MFKSLSEEDKIKGYPPDYFRLAVSKCIWRLIFGKDVTYPEEIECIDKNNNIIRDRPENVVFHYTGDNARAYYFKAAYGNEFLKLEISNYQRRINFNSKTMRNCLAAKLKERLDLIEKSPSEIPRDIISHLVS